MNENTANRLEDVDLFPSKIISGIVLICCNICLKTKYVLKQRTQNNAAYETDCNKKSINIVQLSYFKLEQYFFSLFNSFLD